MKRTLRSENILFFILCAISMFSYSYAMTDSHISSKWYFTIAFLLFSVIILLIRQIRGRIFCVNIYSYALIITTICFTQALYGIFQCSYLLISDNSYHSICGSFDNSSGFAISLSVGVPFILLSLEIVKKKIVKAIMYITVATVVLAIIISGSRTGLISLITIIGFWLCTLYISTKCTFKIPLTICAICLVTFGSYFLRKDSVNGRFLIWQCSWEMIKDAPLVGRGAGCFRANYMDYQADYLKQIPDSEYAMLADNVLCPFNEYLAVILNFGFIGLFTLIAIVFLMIFCYYKSPGLDKKMALLSFLGIGVSAIFSYPFTYPFVWIILFFNTFIITADTFTLKIPIFLAKTIYVSGIVFCLGSSLKLYQYIWAECKWKTIAYHTTDKNLTIYRELIPVLGENPFFLYNYAVSLIEAGYLDESLKYANKCNLYWADYNLELVLGKIYKLQKKYKLAEYHYRKASHMCPCRFIPIYRLFELYEEMGEIGKKYSIAQLIVCKPVKIQSIIVDEIKCEAEAYLRLIAEKKHDI